MEGHFSFGGGEKDVFLAAPLLLFRGVFVAFLIAWWRGLPLGRAARLSALGSLAAVVALWLALLALVLVRTGRQ
jgi:hypothetical protein